MNLLAIRTAVRTQLDVDEEELPDTLLDLYIREAFDRTVSVETQWPMFEAEWEVANAGGADTITLPSTAQPGNVTSLVDVDGYPLVQIDNQMAEWRLSVGGEVARPSYFTLWGGEIRLFPRPNAERQYILRGYRKPLDWVSQGASAEADLDSRLHMLLVYYACSLAYAQQEDEVMEALYMKRWSASLEIIMKAVMKVSHNRPIILNGGLLVGSPAVGVTWNLLP